MSAHLPTRPPPDARAGQETCVFGGLTITHDERVLRPRPWTTAQSRWLAELLRAVPDGPVLELCSGVGHIGLLAGALTGRDLVLVDADPAACELAEKNAAATPLLGAVEVRRGRLEDVVGAHERFAGILADPPWVPSRQTRRFPADPLTAIDGGEDGLQPARACLRVIDRHLSFRGAAVLQLGTVSQAAVISRECVDRGLGLSVVEVRSYGEARSRGVLVRLARP